MYLDILSDDRSLSVNKVLLRAIGAEPAVYFTQLLQLLSTAVRNRTFDSRGYFTVDRDFIKDQLNITAKTQEKYDLMLAELNLVAIDQENSALIGIDCAEVVKLVIGCDAKTIAELTKRAKAAAKTAKAAQTTKTTADVETKQKAILATMKRAIQETDPELYASYCDWVDSVYAHKKFLTKRIIEIFMSGINAYTDDKQIKLAVLQHAITTGYSEAAWVINRYEGSTGSRQASAVATMRATPQRESSGVRSDVLF